MNTHARSRYALWKDSINTGLDLLGLRLQMARLEFVAYKQNLYRAVLWVIFSVVLFFLGFICLLFGLNQVLSPEAKVWVFFGLALASFGAVGLMLHSVWRYIHDEKNFMRDTVQGLNEDLAYLRGQRQFRDLNLKEWLDE